MELKKYDLVLQCIENPTYAEIRDVLLTAGLNIGVEVSTLYVHCHLYLKQNSCFNVVKYHTRKWCNGILEYLTLVIGLGLYSRLEGHDSLNLLDL